MELEEKKYRSNARLVNFRGEMYAIGELAKLYKIPSNILWSRIMELGWSVEDAVTIPVGQR